jgi:hypothetical protein
MKAKPNISANCIALPPISEPINTISVDFITLAIISGLGTISILTGGIGNIVVTVLVYPAKV